LLGSGRSFRLQRAVCVRPFSTFAQPPSPCDVLVIGGGPAGSTIAALLADRGESVTLVEKDRHPRFHIGESLLPLNLPLFERLGVGEEIARIGMPKYGVEFISPVHGRAMTLDFAAAWDKTFPYAYQVRRSEFDHVLLKNAARRGATIVEGCRITEVEFLEDGGAIAKGRDDEGNPRAWQTRFLVDASGRDTFLASRLGVKERNRRHSSAAVFGHFIGARRLSGKAEGNITIFWFDHGWFWFIPLADGTTSVGAVCPPEFIKARTGDVKSFFQSTIAMCPGIAERLEGAQLTGPATATGNYSYRAQRMTGKNYIMLGDAFAFIDPVFSTGVYLAMMSAFAGAETVTTCLHQPRKAARALRAFDRQIRGGIDSFSWYIYRVTRPALRDLFMTPSNRFRVLEAMMSLLAGDIYRRSPVRSRLMLFKAFYYAKSIPYVIDGFLSRFGSKAPKGGQTA
jgi:2-polyprenyl-6-methoxyphenol hydroxylase-like FAD-dependent oxidoreductase